MSELVHVNAENVEGTSFFCKMSAVGEPGYENKLTWLRARFEEGMRIKMLGRRKSRKGGWQGERGFIEYIPGEFAWRGIDADGWMVVHCVWVVGKSKGTGGGRRLLDACIEDARDAGMQGVAMLASKGNWATSPDFLEHFGFEEVCTAPPAFSLMALPFDRDASELKLSAGVRNGPAAYPEGLTALVSAQCPYNAAALDIIRDVAGEQDIGLDVIQLETAKQLRQMAPSAYGTFNLVLNGQLISYSHMLRKQLEPLIEAHRG